ncbi:MAG: hypothetical protein QXG65_02065 [Thermoplasmata archaeon]
MSAPAADPRAWGQCLFCGDAVPPGSATCPICGSDNPVRAREIPRAAPPVRRRLKALGGFRLALVVGAAALLAWAVITPVLQGPPVVADPLTQSGTYLIPAGNVTVLSGEVTGADYILGNFSVVSPFGLSVGMVVYNTTEYQHYREGIAAGNQSYLAPERDGRIDFVALYTDTFYFVFFNPYPPSTHFTESVFIETQYTPSVQSFDVVPVAGP